MQMIELKANQTRQALMFLTLDEINQLKYKVHLEKTITKRPELIK